MDKVTVKLHVLVPDCPTLDKAGQKLRKSLESCPEGGHEGWETPGIKARMSRKKLEKYEMSAV